VHGYIKFTTANETLANATPMTIDIYIEQGLSATETYTIEIDKGVIPDARCRKVGAIFNPTNVNLRDEEYYCNRFNARSKCALGDLSGRYGLLYAQNHGFNTTWYDHQLSLNGRYSITDRSVFIRNSTGGPVTCANIKFADPTMQRRRASTASVLGISQATMAGWAMLAVVFLVVYGLCVAWTSASPIFFTKAQPVTQSALAAAKETGPQANQGHSPSAVPSVSKTNPSLAAPSAKPKVADRWLRFARHLAAQGANDGDLSFMYSD
ncbi:hypothetical protein H4R35_006191, partial [Dimargaris xerosporica]